MLNHDVHNATIMVYLLGKIDKSISRCRFPLLSLVMAPSMRNGCQDCLHVAILAVQQPIQLLVISGKFARESRESIAESVTDKMKPASATKYQEWVREGLTTGYLGVILIYSIGSSVPGTEFTVRGGHCHHLG